jgi:hypothetical protein
MAVKEEREKEITTYALPHGADHSLPFSEGKGRG